MILLFLWREATNLSMPGIYADVGKFAQILGVAPVFPSNGELTGKDRNGPTNQINLMRCRLSYIEIGVRLHAMLADVQTFILFF